MKIFRLKIDQMIEEWILKIVFSIFNLQSSFFNQKKEV